MEIVLASGVYIRAVVKKRSGCKKGTVIKDDGSILLDYHHGRMEHRTRIEQPCCINSTCKYRNKCIFFPPAVSDFTHWYRRGVGDEVFGVLTCGSDIPSCLVNKVDVWEYSVGSKICMGTHCKTPAPFTFLEYGTGIQHQWISMYSTRGWDKCTARAFNTIESACTAFNTSESACTAQHAGLR